MLKKKKKTFPKLTVKIQEAYKLHSLQVEWEEWKRGDRLARTANERMQSLPFSLIPAPFSPSPLLPHSTADLRARTRIHSHTNTNKLSQANFKARLNLFSSRQDDSRGHFSPSRSSSVRSKSYLFMFSLSRLLVLIFGVLWQPVTLHVWFYRDNQSWSKTPLFPIQGNFLKFVLCVIWPWLKVMNKPGRQNKMNKALSVLYWVLIM